MIKKSGSIQSQFINDLAPSATGMAFKKPASIALVNAKAVVVVVVDRAAGGPATTAGANAF